LGRILIIDDENNLRELIARMLELEEYKVFQAPDAKTGLRLLSGEEIDVILCDVKLPDANGVELVETIKDQYPAAEILLLTAYGTIPDSVRAIKSGAFDYIAKGEGNNQIVPVVHRAMEKAHLQRRVHFLEKTISEKFNFNTILGSSKPLLQAVDLAKKVSATDTTVLLSGETGTGKEVFAQAIHYASVRKLKPFVAVNCSAFAKDLLDSEMFGYRAGAFTGATKDKKGLLDEANHGTFFLDEIGELDLDLQAKLLRVLETGEFNKVGDSKLSKVDVRIIAATNRNLSEDVEKENFRSDLYYRISVFQIPLPPLRERKSDIEFLAEHFITTYSHKVKKRVRSMDKYFREALQHYEWKGNIRELRNVIERAVILTESEILTADLLPAEMRQRPEGGENNFSAYDLQSAEKKHIQKILQMTGGNKAEAARLLNIGLTTLYRKIQEYHI
jgi:two-component system NtrC family response regulator